MRALGVSYMDLGLLHGPALDRATVLKTPESAAQAIRDTGIQVSNIYWMFGDNPNDRAISQREAHDANKADLQQVLSFAQALDCPSLFLLPGVHRPHQ